MFKVGEYREEVARDIANHLKEAGMKVDVRTFSTAWSDSIDHLEGRMSELQGELDEEDFQDCERYIDALRSVLSRGATPENFNQMFQMELDPEVNEKRQLFRDIMEGNLSLEERKAKMENFTEMMNDLGKISDAQSLVYEVLSRNKIEVGEDVGDRLDDPIVRIPYLPEDDEEESRFAKITTILTFNPRAAVFIDEFSAILVDELDEEFRDEYEDEFFEIYYLGEMISNLRKSSSGKMDAKRFYEMCALQAEEDGYILKVNGRDVGQEIARSLEKNGILKIKGDGIKWKR
ncbi:hypothetical protein [Candidatus Methanocrinis natronophilus]|uniref:Uncharacterized protein n=1 Tax=Candidatus Methanocrinis natronophilus TaxID=3033396 RepID=A0ABT5X4N7_9EURY|nr:hypothetical protein [Candidatus Methanocrinis natronophilus]MDF0589666.1 hypothetical protein [Candidatus Methanocrinis natronophilus]